ncbi:MAG: hypothetical protein CMO80_22460 [Verrucomicrobiales bacterium]|nr:hypothetical protein [Verrucomicrobiales bacterium]
MRSVIYQKIRMRISHGGGHRFGYGEICANHRPGQHRCLLALCIGLLTAFPQSVQSNETGRRIASRIANFHMGADPNGAKLRLVYFHPNDQPPQKGYRERISRIMFDIRDFLFEGMERHGLGRRELPLELDGEQVKLHVVEGKGGLDSYNYDVRYGAMIREELVRALKGKVDFEREFVLVFGGLARKLGELEYEFRSPYYGFGIANQKLGLCFAADCELLDPKYFTDEERDIVYIEHSGRFERTLGAFNCLYIGGIAHELGHGLSLPHNGQTARQWNRLGVALMGGGNYTYRRDLIGERGSFLTFASALRLAAHPLFTQSDRQRFGDPKATFNDLRFSSEKNLLRVTGRVSGSPEVVAVIAYTDPVGGEDYDAHSWVSEIKEGRFEFAAGFHRRKKHVLRLTALHANGATRTIRIFYDVVEGIPDAGTLNGSWTVSQAEALYMAGNRKDAAGAARAALELELSDTPRRRLEHLIRLASPPRPLLLSKVSADSVSLSDVEWASAEVGWAKPARNQYFSGRGVRDGVCLMVGGKFHAKGLYAHAASRYVFDLAGNWKQFTATAGLQQGVVQRGSGVFTIIGDGKTLHKSQRLRLTQTEEIDVSVEGIKRLELVVESGKADNFNCWTVWGSPILSR